jgi:glycolate oxidase
MEDRTEIYPRTPKATLLKEEPGLKAETLLFFGCVPSYLDMKIVPSLFTLAEAADLDFTTLGANEICCGLPIMLMGSEDFESHAKMMVSRIKATGARELVTPCAGCYKTFKEHYQDIGGLDLSVYHTVEYLERLINEGAIRLDRKIGKKVTYHDPCDLGRTFKIFEQPRNIIKKIPGIKFVEMSKNRDEARCCGGGGGVQAYNPDLSVSMATQRVRDALAVGAEIIVSGCAACKDNLKKGAQAIPKEERGKLKVMDITEIVAKVMG